MPPIFQTPSRPCGAARAARPAHARSQRWLAGAVVGAAAWTLPAAQAATPPARGGHASPPPVASSAPPNSSLDAPLFYQLLISELEWSSGRAANAFQVMIDAARRHRDAQLFERAAQMALQARAGEDALGAAKAWSSALPQDARAWQLQARLLLGLQRPGEAQAALAQWLQRAPAAQRESILLGMPELLIGLEDKVAAQQAMVALAQPWRDVPATRTAARLSVARMQWAAGRRDEALRELTALHADAPGSVPVALVAIDFSGERREAEAIVQDYLQHPGAQPSVRRAWARALARMQRPADAQREAQRVVSGKPGAEDWLLLGALQVDARQPKDAEASVQKAMALLEQADAPPVAPARPGAASSATAQANAEPADGEDDRDGDDAIDLQQRMSSLAQARRRGQWNQARMLMAQAAQQRNDPAGAERWLAQVDDPAQILQIQSQRAQILARQGKLAEARALIRQTPVRGPEDEQQRTLAEAELLREAKQWKEAGELLQQAAGRQPDNPDLIYQLAMVEEKQERFDAMEQNLRRVIQLRPAYAHAYNALGYSLAERRVRLDEAETLIRKALTITPHDAYIQDSLGWVHFRRGRTDEALKVLREAYAARPDTEIAAHLGEVLWTAGQREEARRIWREGRQRDPSNDVLLETLRRLGVAL